MPLRNMLSDNRAWLYITIIIPIGLLTLLSDAVASENMNMYRDTVHKGIYYYDTTTSLTIGTFGSDDNGSDRPTTMGLVVGNGVQIVLVKIPAGTHYSKSVKTSIFYDGLPEVKVNKFWIGQTEITQKQYEIVMSDNPSKFTGSNSNPVESVTWSEAMEFCDRVSSMSSKMVTLPTEVQWEYACKAGGKGLFTVGRGLFSILRRVPKTEHKIRLDSCWIRINSSYETHPVALKYPNAWNLFDMYGNVSEMTITEHFMRDGRNNTYEKYWFIKGGNFTDDPGDEYPGLSYTARAITDKYSRSFNRGFRVVLIPENKMESAK